MFCEKGVVRTELLERLASIDEAERLASISVEARRNKRQAATEVRKSY